MAAAYDGGAGGKFRKKPTRRHQSTPYDRPPTNGIGRSQKNGWLSRIVDPASRIIAAGAHKLFASVFTKRILPPPEQKLRSAGGNEERRDSMLAAASTEGRPLAEEQTGSDSTSLKATREGDGIVELEQILRQKNFTRSELERLTALLHSKTTDVPNGVGKERPGTAHEENHQCHSREVKIINGPVLENGIRHNALTAPMSDPSLDVVEEDMAAPVDLAKAYMASRSTKVSPSMLGSQSQSRREDPPFPGSPIHLRSPGISRALKPYNAFSTHENASEIQRSRGKSAIYSVSRPCRVQPTLTHKGSGASFDTRPSSSSSSFQNAIENSQFDEPKKSVLKRRSSVLENDIGPIRRIRQKPNLIASKSITLSVSGNVHAARGSEVASAGIALPVVQNVEGPSSSNFMAERTDGKMNNQRSKYTPSKSVEMGQRILQQLDKLSPKDKPKGKSSSIAAGKSPSELTPDMLHGQARRSLETVDSYKLLQSVELNNYKGCTSNVVNDVPISTYEKEHKVSYNGPIVPRISADKLAAESSVDGGRSTKASLSIPLAKHTAVGNIDDPPKKRRAFQMSAPEDIELDDDVHTNGETFASSERKKDDSTVNSAVLISREEALHVPNPPILDNAVSVPKKSVFFEPTSTSVSVATQKKEPEHEASTASVAENNSDFTFPAAAASSPAFLITGNEATVSQTSESREVVVSQHLNTGPAFGLSQKSSDMVSPSSFTPPFRPESSGSKVAVPELVSSAAPVTSAPVAAPTLLEPDKIEDNKRMDTVKVSGSVTESAISPVLFSNNLTKQSSNGFTQSITTTVATTVAAAAVDTVNEASPVAAVTSNSFSLTSSTPFVESPVFKFGTTEPPAASATQGSTVSGSESTETGLKPKETGLGSQSIPPFTVPPPVTAGEGTGFFGWKASTPANGASLFTSSKPSGDDNVIFGLNSSAPANGVSSYASSTPALFGSGSTSGSITAEPSSTTTTVSASSLLSSKAPPVTPTVNSAAPPFSVGGSGFATASAASTVSGSTLQTSSLSTAMSSSAWQSSKSPLFSTTLNSAPPLTSTAAAVSATGNASGSTSIESSSMTTALGSGSWQSSTPPFSFGATGSATASATGNVSGSTSSMTTAMSLSSGQSSKSPGFPAMFNSVQPSFSFGATSFASTPASTNTPMAFAASGAPSSPAFSFTANSPVFANPFPQSQPSFANPNLGIAFGVTPSSNNSDQMNMEDSMAEDSVQASAPPVMTFAQLPIATPSTGFQFGATPPPAANLFQFGGQPTHQVPAQNLSPFQPSGSLESNPGSFSLGTGGNDKANRKIVKVRRQTNRKR